MKMKKKIISCLLAVSLIAGLAIPAFAVEEKAASTPPEKGTATAKLNEVTFTTKKGTDLIAEFEVDGEVLDKDGTAIFSNLDFNVPVSATQAEIDEAIKGFGVAITRGAASLKIVVTNYDTFYAKLKEVSGGTSLAVPAKIQFWFVAKDDKGLASGIIADWSDTSTCARVEMPVADTTYDTAVSFDIADEDAAAWDTAIDFDDDNELTAKGFGLKVDSKNVVTGKIADDKMAGATVVEGDKIAYVTYVKVADKQLGTEFDSVKIYRNGELKDTFTSADTSWIGNSNDGKDCYFKFGSYFLTQVAGKWYRDYDVNNQKIEFYYGERVVFTENFTVDFKGVTPTLKGTTPPAGTVFTNTPIIEAKDDKVSGGNWYNPPFTGTASASKLVVASNLPIGKVVAHDAAAKSADKVLYDALETVNGKKYPTAETGNGATRNLGMSIEVPEKKGITQVSARVKVGDAAEKNATTYAAKGPSNATAGEVTLDTATGKLAPLGDNTHLVMYPLIAEKTGAANQGSWKIGGPTAYKWTYTYYDKDSKIVGTQVVDVTINYPVTSDKIALGKAIADAKAYKATVFESVDGTDVATTNLWATAGQIEVLTDAITVAKGVFAQTITPAEEAAAVKKLTNAKAALALVAEKGNKKPVTEKPDITGSGGDGSTTITGKENVSDTPAKGDDIKAELPTDDIKAVIDAAAAVADKKTEITVTLPDPANAGTVSEIKVDQAVFAAAAAASTTTNEKANIIVFEVKDSANASQVKWEFDTSKGVPSGAVNLMATPKRDARAVVDTTVTGLDTSADTKADLIKFEYEGSIPAGTKVTVPTTVTSATAYAYTLINGKIDVDSVATVTISGTSPYMAEFNPKHFSDILISSGEISKKGGTVDPPPAYVPGGSHSYGGGGSSSSDKTAEVSANSPAGTEAIVDSSVTNIANPVLDVKATAANAPEVAEFIKATTGFAVANVFQINMFDSTTVVKQVEGGKVEITLPFVAPDTSKQYVVLRYNDDKTVTVIPATLADGKITFRTDHFSHFAVAVRSDDPNLFGNAITTPPTTPTKPTTVPATGVTLLGKLF